MGSQVHQQTGERLSMLDNYFFFFATVSVCVNWTRSKINILKNNTIIDLQCIFTNSLVSMFILPELFLVQKNSFPCTSQQLLIQILCQDKLSITSSLHRPEMSTEIQEGTGYFQVYVSRATQHVLEGWRVSYLWGSFWACLR